MPVLLSEPTLAVNSWGVRCEPVVFQHVLHGVITWIGVPLPLVPTPPQISLMLQDPGYRKQGWMIELRASCWPILFHMAAQGPCGLLGSGVGSELVTSAWASLRAETTVTFLVTSAHLGDNRLGNEADKHCSSFHILGNFSSLKQGSWWLGKLSLVSGSGWWAHRVSRTWSSSLVLTRPQPFARTDCV